MVRKDAQTTSNVLRWILHGRATSIRSGGVPRHGDPSDHHQFVRTTNRQIIPGLSSRATTRGPEHLSLSINTPL